MLYLPLRTVKFILEEFEKNFEKYSIKEYKIDNFKKAIILEDSLVLYIEILKSDFPVCCNVEERYLWTRDNDFMDMPQKGGDYYELQIEELTYNTLGFKYNHSAFLRRMKSITGISYLSEDVTYTKFKGYTRCYWCPDKETLVEKIGKQLPELNLRERYNAWEGLKYYFIVLELKGITGQTEYGVAYTTQKPYKYITSLCQTWIEKGLHGNIRLKNYNEFESVFKSWKGKRKQWRLENCLRYCYSTKNFRETDDVWRYADIVLDKAYNGEYANFEWGTWIKPINRWVSEERVYNIVKKLYKDYCVIYQHRPFFLKSDKGGQLSYDVFIAGLNIAIEYQGKQHFEPVEFFCGEKAFIETQHRDEIKRRLSRENGIKLIYVNYWEDINDDLIKSKLNPLIEDLI